jgi:two-component system, response regulator YesN
MPSVLVIDDASGTLEPFEGVLREAGFDVALARTGHEGLELVRRRTIDLVLATLQPADRAALDILRALRREVGAIPFVIVTGIASMTQDASAVESGTPGARHRVQTLPVADDLLNVVMSLVRQPLSRFSSAGAGSVNRLNYQAIHAVQLIEARYGEPELTVRSLAHDLSISTEHLCRLLKRDTEHTFVAILRHARVRAARQLLRTTNLSMKQIANRVGFRSASRFDRDFKNVCGIPPTEYRISDVRRSQRVTQRR